MQFAKRQGLASVLVGHVTKEGAFAGPRVLEHMVDTVLYFEGDRGHSFRILRAVKNRFGSTNEIGVFEMKENGLQPVANPSALFLAERPVDVPGSVVVASIEGTRPILVELQALVSPSSLGTPRRTTLGMDPNRVALLVAILEKKMGLQLTGHDIFLNVAGGVRLDEPAADLGAVLAVASSFLDRPVDPHTLVGRRSRPGRRGARHRPGRSARARGRQAGLQALRPAGELAPPTAPVDGVELRGVAVAQRSVGVAVLGVGRERRPPSAPSPAERGKELIMRRVRRLGSSARRYPGTSGRARSTPRTRRDCRRR